MVFDSPEQVPFLLGTKIYLKLVAEMIAPILQMVLPMMTLFAGYFFIQGETLTEALGLYTSCSTIICYNLVISFNEKLGVVASDHFGNGFEFNKMKASIFYAFMTFFIFYFAAIIPLFIFSKEILLLLGLHAESIEYTSKMLIFSIPLALIIGVNDIIKTYLFSQGIEKPYLYITLTSFASSLITIYVCFTFLGMGIYSYVVMRYVYECIYCVGCVYLYIRWAGPKTKGIPKVKAFWVTFFWYFLDSVKFCFTNSFEWVSDEIYTILAGQRSPAETAAFLQYVNVNLIIYNVGTGISFGLRTRLNILFGLEKFQTGRRVYYWFVTCTMILGFILGSLLFSTSPFLAWIFNKENESGQVILGKCLRIYAIAVPIDFVNATNLTVMRSIGKVNITLIFCIFCYLPVSCFLGYYAIMKLDLDVTHLV